MIENDRISLMFRALGDENRIAIIKMLSSGEKCACSLLKELNVTQPTLSHHMRILCECGLVSCRKEGKWAHYSINRSGFKYIKEFFSDLQ